MFPQGITQYYVLGKPTSIEEFRALLDDLRLDPAED